jgi:hypothetical protein
LSFIEDEDPANNTSSHCCAQRNGKAVCRAVKPEDLPDALEVKLTDEDSVAHFDSHHGIP